MPPQMTMSAAMPIEFETLLARCMGDKDFTREMLGLFRGQSMQQLAGLQSAIAAGDVEAVRKVSHAMKGSAANLSADPLSKLCAGIEQGAKTGAMPPASAVGELIQELDRVFAFYPTIESKL